MKDTHISLCTHKAWFSEWLTYGESEVIRACGGHGYNLFSGISSLLIEDFPNMILEGENSVLFLQASKDLLGALRLVNSGEAHRVKGPLAYLKRGVEDFELPSTLEDFRDTHKLFEVLKHSCLINTTNVGIKMMEEIGNGHDPKYVANTLLGSRLWDLGKLQGLISIIENAEIRLTALKSDVLKDVYQHVLNFFMLDVIEQVTRLVARTESIHGSGFEHIQVVKEEILDFLDDHALVLCEGINIHDNTLMSAIGHSNGKPYENLYSWAKKYGSLNHLKNGVHPGILEHYHPYRNKKLQEMNNNGQKL